MPVAPSAPIAPPFSRATASTLAMNSRCSRCALLTSATVGAAIAASRAISPTWFMPSSITRRGRRGRRRNRVSGTPMSLLKLPCVANAASPCQARKIDAIICVTVVLPLLPVTATSGIAKRRRQRGGEVAERGRVSATSGRAAPASSRPRSASAATAPAALACGEKRVRVEALAAQGDEEVARREAARVAVDARERVVALPTRRAPGSAARLAEGRHRRRCARVQPAGERVAAWRASANGSFAPPTSW